MIRLKIFAIISMTFFAWLLVGTAYVSAACTEPDMSDYQCYPIFQSNSVEPNIVILLDNGAEMKYAITHSDYDSSVTYTPVAGVTVEAIEDPANATGFYNVNGYAIANNGNRYAIVPILDTLAPGGTGPHDTYLDGDSNSYPNRYTISGTTPITLPYMASASVDSNGVKDNAGYFRYSMNYLNWLFFSGGGKLTLRDVSGAFQDREEIVGSTSGATGFVCGLLDANVLRYDSAVYHPGTGISRFAVGEEVTGQTTGVTGTVLSTNYYNGNGTDLPTKSRFYYAKKAFMTVAEQTLRKAKFGIYNFANDEGGSQVQPIGYITQSGEPDGVDDDSDGDTDDQDEILESNFINNVNNMGTVLYSPLAEALTTIGGYFDSQSSHIVAEDCQKNFVIVISPGRSSADVTDQSATQNEPDSISGITSAGGSLTGVTTSVDLSWDRDDAAGGIGEGYVRAGSSIYQIPVFQHPTDSTLNGSTWLDDVAAYMSTHDIVSYVSGYQNVMVYTIGFMSDREEYNLFLKNTSNNGNGNINLYDTTDPEYGKYHFEAQSPEALSARLMAAIDGILKRAASGTAVAVLATAGEGEGNLVQAYFKPSVTISGATEVKWVGYLQSLWVDSYGNLREDTDGDLGLDVTTDKIVAYFLDQVDGEARIKRYDVSGTTPYPNLVSASYEVKELSQISPLWEAGSLLAQRDANDRKIFTYIDKNKDFVAGEPVGDYDPFDDDGEIVRFHTSGVTDIQPYLGVRDSGTWSYLGVTQRDRAHNLIEYIRGKETGFLGTTTMHIRSRIIDGNVWKLGDIAHSTPVSISRPPDNYHLIYSDASYQEYYDAFKDREMVVYVGANDGMLHAFTSWNYSGASKQYTKPATAPVGESIGDELWAYIPQSLIPHLKWLPASNYSHVYYVDLKPKIFDAKIIADGTHYTDSGTTDDWGTILLAGLRMGGKEICVEDDFDDGSGTTVYETRTFYPSYVCMDITDPRNPRLLWERTYQGLGMTTSRPAVIKVNEKWFAVFGSGITDYEGSSNQPARVFVVDLKTGDSISGTTWFASGTTDGWLFQSGESNAFMNSPVSLDKELNYNVDAIYFGESYNDSGTWKGKVYRVSVPWNWNDTATYVDNPNSSTSPWSFSRIFDATRPITAPVSLSLDSFDNTWVYFGTGRYIGQADKTNTDTQYLFGIVDPFFNSFYDASQ
ncbi:MAG: PilC/PilY family type IV pilus protein, partial [Thermodesulfobacteriota bacterium]|nr:PilC/PilY family type IV pilus protein [Thermodesulfobacteriota bacterium]